HLLLRAADNAGRVVVGACRGIVAEERVYVPEHHEEERVLRVQFMPPGVLCPRLLQVALCAVGAAELEMTGRLVRGELLGLLHVLDRLRKVAGLPEYVGVPERGV